MSAERASADADAGFDRRFAFVPKRASQRQQHQRHPPPRESNTSRSNLRHTPRDPHPHSPHHPSHSLNHPQSPHHPKSPQAPDTPSSRRSVYYDPSSAPAPAPSRRSFYPLVADNDDDHGSEASYKSATYKPSSLRSLTMSSSPPDSPDYRSTSRSSHDSALPHSHRRRRGGFTGSSSRDASGHRRYSADHEGKGRRRTWSEEGSLEASAGQIWTTAPTSVTAAWLNDAYCPPSLALDTALSDAPTESSEYKDASSVHWNESSNSSAWSRSSYASTLSQASSCSTLKSCLVSHSGSHRSRPRKTVSFLRTEEDEPCREREGSSEHQAHRGHRQRRSRREFVIKFKPEDEREMPVDSEMVVEETNVGMGAGEEAGVVANREVQAAGAGSRGVGGPGERVNGTGARKRGREADYVDSAVAGAADSSAESREEVVDASSAVGVSSATEDAEMTVDDVATNCSSNKVAAAAHPEGQVGAAEVALEAGAEQGEEADSAAPLDVERMETECEVGSGESKGDADVVGGVVVEEVQPAVAADLTTAPKELSVATEVAIGSMEPQPPVAADLTTAPKELSVAEPATEMELEPVAAADVALEPQAPVAAEDEVAAEQVHASVEPAADAATAGTNPTVQAETGGETLLSVVPPSEAAAAAVAQPEGLSPEEKALEAELIAELEAVAQAEHEAAFKTELNPQVSLTSSTTFDTAEALSTMEAISTTGTVFYEAEPIPDQPTGPFVPSDTQDMHDEPEATYFPTPRSRSIHMVNNPIAELPSDDHPSSAVDQVVAPVAVAAPVVASPAAVTARPPPLPPSSRHPERAPSPSGPARAPTPNSESLTPKSEDPSTPSFYVEPPAAMITNAPESFQIQITAEDEHHTSPVPKTPGASASPAGVHPPVSPSSGQLVGDQTPSPPAFVDGSVELDIHILSTSSSPSRHAMSLRDISQTSQASGVANSTLSRNSPLGTWDRAAQEEAGHSMRPRESGRHFASHQSDRQPEITPSTQPEPTAAASAAERTRESSDDELVTDATAIVSVSSTTSVLTSGTSALVARVVAKCEIESFPSPRLYGNPIYSSRSMPENIADYSNTSSAARTAPSITPSYHPAQQVPPGAPVPRSSRISGRWTPEAFMQRRRVKGSSSTSNPTSPCSPEVYPTSPALSERSTRHSKSSRLRHMFLVAIASPRKAFLRPSPSTTPRHTPSTTPRVTPSTTPRHPAIPSSAPHARPPHPQPWSPTPPLPNYIPATTLRPMSFPTAPPGSFPTSTPSTTSTINPRFLSSAPQGLWSMPVTSPRTLLSPLSPKSRSVMDQLAAQSLYSNGYKPATSPWARMLWDRNTVVAREPKYAVQSVLGIEAGMVQEQLRSQELKTQEREMAVSPKKSSVSLVGCLETDVEGSDEGEFENELGKGSARECGSLSGSMSGENGGDANKSSESNADSATATSSPDTSKAPSVDEEVAEDAGFVEVPVVLKSPKLDQTIVLGKPGMGMQAVSGKVEGKDAQFDQSKDVAVSDQSKESGIRKLPGMCSCWRGKSLAV